MEKVEEIEKEDKDEINISDLYKDDYDSMIAIRSVIQYGASQCITLPFRWVRKYSIGKNVFVEVKGDKLVITPYIQKK